MITEGIHFQQGGTGGTQPDPNAPITWADFLALSEQAEEKARAASASTPESQQYAQARQTFAGMGPLASGIMGYHTSGGPIRSPEGWYSYASGVLANPSTGQILFPTAQQGFEPKDVPGSPEWLIAIQEEWDDEKADTWRKRLIDLGYIPEGGLAEKGGMAFDLIAGLQMYHETRYLNAGKTLPASPQGAATKENIRSMIDPMVMRNEIKTWTQVPFEEDMDDDTADYFADLLLEYASRLAKNHPNWSPSQVIGTPSGQYGGATGAYARVERDFLKTPGVKGAIRDAEEDEVGENLRNSIVSISQLGSI